MNALEHYYPEACFGGFTDIDGTLAFYSRVNALLEPTMTVVDFGCGPGSYGSDHIRLRRSLRILKGKVARVIGLDVDEHAAGNPFVDEFRLLGEGHRWPVESQSVGLVLSDCVLEHLLNPEEFFREVLARGGYFAIRTPNMLSYFGAVARVLPAALKLRCLQAAQPDRDEDNVYVTHYRCNTIRKIRNALKRNNFECVVYGYEAEPRYLAFSNAAYALGVLHQRFVPNRLRISIFAFGSRR